MDWKNQIDGNRYYYAIIKDINEYEYYYDNNKIIKCIGF